MSAQEQTPQEEGFKVFCGNLAFATKDAELSETFGQIGPITNAQIINRGLRSLGYGFITFVNEADALRAVQVLDKSEIAGRQVNVEIAKPAAPPSAPKERAAPVPREVEIGEDGEPIKRAPKKSSRARSKTAKGGRRPRTDGETEEAGDAPAPEFADLRISDPAAQEEAANDAAPRAPRARRAKTPRAPGTAPVRRVGPPTGEPSKTLVFVANLPFSVTDETLKEVFVGYNVLSARVVVKKFPPGEGRSKGFGFVDFASEEEQTRALAHSPAFEVDGREIALKVAVAEAPVADEPIIVAA